MKTVSVWVTGLAAASVAAAEPAPVAYPDGYRFHAKSMELKPGHPMYEAFGGLRHRYANAKAAKGHRTGKFEDGAVMVFDLLEARVDREALVEGLRKVLGVTSRDAERYVGTGSWGFEAFAGGDPRKPLVGGNAVRACFECHASHQASSHVFSTSRD